MSETRTIYFVDNRTGMVEAHEATITAKQARLAKYTHATSYSKQFPRDRVHYTAEEALAAFIRGAEKKIATLRRDLAVAESALAAAQAAVNP